jgi:drug/metabolite transporter (DMT)-like permease
LTETAAPAARSAAGTAVLMMAGATLCFTALDAVLKILATRHGLGMVLFGRNLAQVLFMLALVPLLGTGMFRTHHPVRQCIRGALLIGTTGFITLALLALPMVQTYAITFSTPLMASLIALAFLGEKPRAIQWGLILFGFSGVLVALRPGTPDFTWALIYPFLMALCNATFYVLTRFVGRKDAPLTSVFWSAASATVLTGAALPFVYEPLPPESLGLLAVAGVLGTSAHLLATGAFRRAPTAVVAPMLYTQIVWATLLGFLVFGEVPAAAAMIGAVVVAVSGIGLARVKPA